MSYFQNTQWFLNCDVNISWLCVPDMAMVPTECSVELKIYIS